MLRRAVVAVAAMTLLIALGLLATGGASATAVGIWLAVEAAVLLFAVLFERGRYWPPASSGPWVPSAERFQDPATGRWVRVEYNPRTGERRYVDER